MELITLSAYAVLHGHHRPQVVRWKKEDRIRPRPVPGVSPSGRLGLMVPPDAVILSAKEAKKAE